MNKYNVMGNLSNHHSDSNKNITKQKMSEWSDCVHALYILHSGLFLSCSQQNNNMKWSTLGFYEEREQTTVKFLSLWTLNAISRNTTPV